MTEENRVKIYRTSDMKVAAALLASGHFLADMENHGLPDGHGRVLSGGRKQRSKIKFVFEYTEELHNDLVAYAAGTLQASIKSSYTNLELVKSIITNASFELVDKATMINNSIKKG